MYSNINERKEGYILTRDEKKDRERGNKTHSLHQKSCTHGEQELHSQGPVGPILWLLYRGRGNPGHIDDPISHLRVEVSQVLSCNQETLGF